MESTKSDIKILLQGFYLQIVIYIHMINFFNLAYANKTNIISILNAGTFFPLNKAFEMSNYLANIQSMTP